MSSVASRVPPPAVPQGLPPALETSTQPTLPFHSFTRVIITKTSEKKNVYNGGRKQRRVGRSEHETGAEPFSVCLLPHPAKRVLEHTQSAPFRQQITNVQIPKRYTWH